MRRHVVGLVALSALSMVAAACGGPHHHLERVAGGATTSSSAPTVAAGTEPPTTTVPAPTPVNTPAPAPRRAPATTNRTQPPGTPAPAPAGPNLNAVRVRLTQVATLDQPLAMAVRTGDGALYFAQKGGGVRALRGGQVDPVPVLDLSGQVSTGSEQGLLGLAFAPDGTHMYVNYTDTVGDTHVTEFAFGGGRADPASRRDVLFVHQPYANHNGGNLVFGPDGVLWIGLGDGGSAGDPSNNAQSDGTFLGKMTRLDPRPGGQTTVWAKGLRNPWRYSFDRATGDLWIGDVGQDAWEEVDFHPAGTPGGLNYGWSAFEGNHVYNATRSAPGAVFPIYEYPHGGGVCAVTGGFVYRGSRIPAMNGAYLVADFCVGQVSALAQGGGRIVAQRQLGLQVSNLSSFGEDQAGELYALSLDGPVYRIDPA